MYIEQKLDQILENQKKLDEKINLFLPDLTTQKGVIHFLEITKNTFNTYFKNGTFVEGIHYIEVDKKIEFIQDEIIKLKKSGVKGKRKSSKNQDKIDAVNIQLGIISKCRSAV